MSWLTWTDIVPPPESRVPLSLESFSQLFLPSLLFYYATAVLVIVPGTFYPRLALLPLTLWSAFRTGARLDVVAEYHDDRLIYLNQGLTLAMFTLVIRVVIWTFQLQPFYRTPDPNKPRPSDEESIFTPAQVACDAFELCCNLRGIGWNWSKGLRIPKETRPIHSRTAFVLSILRSFILTVLFMDFCHYSVQWFSPSTIGSAVGGSIFDPAMLPLRRYLRSTFITFLSGLTVCCGIQIGYFITTLCGVLLFHNEPSQWPPIFDSPWFATSLSDFWARRWHQAFRDLFVSCGSKPLSRIFGRLGTVMGAFLISGLLHVVGLWGMGRGTEFWTVAGYFLVMGVGVVLERWWKEVTGHRIGGITGNIWALAWVMGWGNMLVDAWARKGLVGSVFFTQDTRPMNHIAGAFSKLVHYYNIT